MKKSKTFWAATALISLAVMVFAGYSIYGRVSLHLWGDTIEVRPVPLPEGVFDEEEEAPEEKKEEPVKEAGKAPEPEKTAAKPAPKPAPAPAAKQEEDRPKAVKTVFEYKGPGKTIELAGSFTSWKPVPMKQKGGVWKAEVYILPGTYPYHFKVDGKKTPDKGKPAAPTGDSLVTVEPRN